MLCGRPRPGWSFSPSSRSPEKRLRHFRQLLALSPVRFEISVKGKPSAAAKTTLALVAKIRLVESSDYKIKSLPDTPSDENIIFKAEILFNEIMPDGSISPEQERIVQCVRASVRK